MFCVPSCRKAASSRSHFDHGKSFLLTALVAVNSDNGSLLFDVGSDEGDECPCPEGRPPAVLTSLDKVKVQFSLKSLNSATHDGRSAFRASLPETVLRPPAPRVLSPRNADCQSDSLQNGRSPGRWVEQESRHTASGYQWRWCRIDG